MSGTLGTRTGHRVHALAVTAEPAHTDALPAAAAVSGAGRRPCPAEGVRAPGRAWGAGSGPAAGSDGLRAPGCAWGAGSAFAAGPDGMRAPGPARGAGSGPAAGLGHGGGRQDERGGDEPFADGRGLVAGTARRRARRAGGRGRGRAPVRLFVRGAGHANTPTEGGR